MTLLATYSILLAERTLGSKPYDMDNFNKVIEFYLKEKAYAKMVRVDKLNYSNPQK